MPMKIAVMQPYFIPYIGYFQLMSAVDQFVVFDDVNYIKRGWINRNRILLNGQPHYLTLPISGASQNRIIQFIELDRDKIALDKKLSMIRHAYSKAPFFDATFSLAEKLLGCPENNLCRFIVYSLKIIAAQLGIPTRFCMSSELKKDSSLKGQEKILEICRVLGADHYINSIGGRGLYENEAFARNGIRLSFLSPDPIEYPQFGGGFVPDLSIVDVMMFNSREACREFLKDYHLID